MPVVGRATLTSKELAPTPDRATTSAPTSSTWMTYHLARTASRGRWLAVVAGRPTTSSYRAAVETVILSARKNTEANAAKPRRLVVHTDDEKSSQDYNLIRFFCPSFTLRDSLRERYVHGTLLPLDCICTPCMHYTRAFRGFNFACIANCYKLAQRIYAEFVLYSSPQPCPPYLLLTSSTRQSYSASVQSAKTRQSQVSQGSDEPIR